MVETSHDSAQLSAEIAALPEVLSTQGLVSFLLRHGQCSETDLRVQLYHICQAQGVQNTEGACWRIFGFPATHEFEVGVARDLKQLRKLRIFGRQIIFTDSSHAKYPATPAGTVTWDDVRRIIKEEEQQAKARDERALESRRVAEVQETTRRLARLTWSDFLLEARSTWVYVGLSSTEGLPKAQAADTLAGMLDLPRKNALNIIEEIGARVQTSLRKGHVDDFRWNVGKRIGGELRRGTDRGYFGVGAVPVGEGKAVKITKLSQ